MLGAPGSERLQGRWETSVWAAALLTTGEILTHTPPYDCVTILLTLTQITHAFSSTGIFGREGHALQPFVRSWHQSRMAELKTGCWIWTQQSLPSNTAENVLFWHKFSVLWQFFFFFQPQLLCHILPQAVVNKERSERHFLLESTLEHDEAE